MKKFLTLCTALLLFGSMTVVQAEDYYVAGTMNDWNNTNDANKMSWGSGNIYSKTISAMYPTSYQFQISTFNWGNQYGGYYKDNSLSNVSLMGTGQKENITFTLSTTSDVTFYFDLMNQRVYVIATPVVVPSYTFPNGTTIYYDFTAYGGGVNVCINGSEPWQENTSAIFSETLNAAWEVTATTHLFKSAPNSWSYKTCSTLPTEGQNMLVGDADGIGCHWDTYVPAPPTIKMHGNFTGSWNTTNAFVVADGNATASLSLTIPTKGIKNFGMRIGSDDNWTSNGASITPNKTSAMIVAGEGNCSLDAVIPGEYIFTWTYSDNTLSVKYPDLPTQYVEFDGLAANILKSSTPTVFAATSTGITNPVYTYYVKPAGGEYGSAVTSYTFDTEGSFTVKVSVEGDNTIDPVVEEQNVVVYSTYTFTEGTRIYVDFTAVSNEDKGVNYPKNNKEGIDYDANGAGTFKTIRFSTDVTWSTLSDFIKTAKADWAGLKFTAPGEGQNKIIVAADGASYTWGTYTPATVQVKFFAPRDETNKWEHVYAYSWDAVGAITGWTTDEVTRDGDWYVYNVQVGANLLFHDGNGMQTKDINNIQASACYESTEIDYESAPKKVTVTANANCKIAYHIAGSKNLIEGESEEGFDVNLPLDENNQIIFHDVEPGTYAFKINNGTWAWSIGGIDHMKEGECASIAQEVGVGDLGFKIDTKQDVTVTYYPGTQEICLGAVTVKATTTVEGADMNIKAGESKKLAFSTNNTENPGVTYTVLSGSEYIGLFQNVITGIKEGTTTVRVSLAETANYTAASDEFTITVSNPVAPAKAIEAIGGKFIINAKGDTAIFSRGNLKYNVATGEWYCAEKQYDFVGEGGNLHFGDANYTGEFDLFGWSCTASNYGLMQSNHDEVYTGDFVDWGTKFSGEKTWSTLSSSQWQYMQANQNWTMIVLDPTPEVAENEDEIRGMAVFPYDWVTPAGFESLRMKFYDLDDEEKLADNTIALADWSTLEAAGAVFLPMAGARAGHWGNTWNGKEESDRKNPNPNGGQSYCFVDNIGWYGYYWLATTDSRSDHPYDAMYLICPSAYNTGKKDEHDEEIWAWSAPAVWSREKRRGNSVRLATFIPRQYSVTYTAGDAEGDVPTDENKYLDGAEVTLASASGLSKEGYRFAGWKFKGQVYEGSYTVNNVLRNEEIVFEAQWEEDWTVVREDLQIGRHYTVCLPKNVLETRGATFWSLDKKNSENTMVYLEEEAAPFNEGMPYIFQATADKLEVVYGKTSADNGLTNGALVGTLEYLNAAALEAVEGTVYMLFNNELRPLGTNNHLDANRAYVLYNLLESVSSAPAPAPGKKVKGMPMHKNTPTGIDAINDAEGPVKMIIDGQLYILRGEKMYNATGCLVK